MKFGSEIDLGDIFGSGLMSLLLSGLIFLAGLWLGLMMGEAALAAGEFAATRSLDFDWLLGPFGRRPVAVFSWMLIGVLGLGASYFKFSRLDGGGAIRWGIFVGAIGTASLGMRAHELNSGWFPLGAAWTAWALMLAMIGSALWFMRQWQMNRWATELAMLQAENAARRIEMEAEAEE